MGVTGGGRASGNAIGGYRPTRIQHTGHVLTTLPLVGRDRVETGASLSSYGSGFPVTSQMWGSSSLSWAILSLCPKWVS